MKRKTIYLWLVLAMSQFAGGQSVGAGGMSYSGYVDGVYFNVTADFDFKFAMYGDEASTQLRFNWFKVNYVEYNGVRYDRSNHPGGSANFDYLNDGYQAKVKLTEYVPTKGYMDRTKTVYPKSWNDFRFSAGGEAWENLGIDRRIKQKEKWRNRTSPGTISCQSVSGREIDNIVRAVKNRQKQSSQGNQNSTASTNTNGAGHNSGTSTGTRNGGATNSGTSTGTRNSGTTNSGTSSERSGTSTNTNSGTTYGTNNGRGTSSTNKRSSTTTQSREAERQRRLERQAQEYQRKQAEQAARRKAYEDFARAQNNRNQQIAAAGALAGIGALAIFGKLIYGKMGYFKPGNAYKPGEVQFKASFQFGYSQLVQPMWFNSVYTNSFGTNTGLKYTYAWPTCFGFGMDIGLEHDYVGGEAYGGIRGGSSIFVTNYMWDINYGLRAYAGLPYLKGFFELGYGERQIWMNDWVTFEQSGEGFSDMLWENVKYGLRISWGDYVRQHITAGVIYEAAGVYSGRIQIMENLNPAHDPNVGYGNSGRPKIGEVYSSKFLEGYFFEWKKDHSFNFFLQVFPNYPFTGSSHRGGSAEAAEANIDGGVFVNVGFVRSVDGFLGF